MKSTFLNDAIIAWNKAPNNIKNCKSLNTVKSIRYYFVDLKSNSALKSNKSHNLLKVFFTQIMSNNSYFPTKRRILIQTGLVSFHYFLTP